jgi:RNA polymerase sigma factor (sigma-70 family)
MEEMLMIFKNPEENEQRRHRYHSFPLSAANEDEIARHEMQDYFRQLDAAEWRRKYIPKINAALKTLSPRQTQVLELYAIRKLGQAEVAGLMQCSQQTVSRLYAKTIRQIREYIME